MFCAAAGVGGEAAMFDDLDWLIGKLEVARGELDGLIAELKGARSREAMIARLLRREVSPAERDALEDVVAAASSNGNGGLHDEG